VAFRFRASCGLFLCSLAWPSAASAQDFLVAALVKSVDDVMASTQRQMPHWTTAATWNLTFAIAVGLLGIVAAALPLLAPAEDKGAERKGLSRHQVAVIIVGTLISGLTLVMNLAFAADYREYWKSSAQAGQLIIGLGKGKASFQRDPDVRAYDQLERLGDNITETQRSDLSRLFAKVMEQDAKTFGEPVKQLEEIEKHLIATALPLGAAVVYAAVPPGPIVTATAEANDAWQAEQNSYSAAVQKMVAQLIRSASLKVGDRELDGLRKYIDQYAKSDVSPEGGANPRIRIRTQLTMPASYANPSLINAFLRAQSVGTAVATREQEIEKIRSDFKSKGSKGNLEGFLEATATVSLQGGPVRLQATDPKDGDFVFRFGVQPPLRQGQQNAGAAAQVRLEAMEINQDSSAGSTRWTFYVLSQGRVIISLPEQRWDDSKRPTICWWEPDAGLMGQAAVTSGGVPLTIVGIKPKVLSLKQ
jgi:hypothetical protein